MNNKIVILVLPFILIIASFFLIYNNKSDKQLIEESNLISQNSYNNKKKEFENEEEETDYNYFTLNNQIQDKNKIKTVVKDNNTKKKLLGEHGFSLQWISWNYFGKVNIFEIEDTLFISGKQIQKDGNDYVMINGIITEVDKLEFKFNGNIITQVSHNNDGKPCLRQGNMIFKIKDNRPFWRLQQMLNPCDGVVTDYVDISR